MRRNDKRSNYRLAWTLIGASAVAFVALAHYL